MNRSLPHPSLAPGLFRPALQHFRKLAIALSLTMPLVKASDSFFIREFRVEGATVLQPLPIEEAVYPFLGPERSYEDVEKARQALEKTFRDAGYSTVSVIIPNQDPRPGVIRLQVVEGRVSRLRVVGSRYYLPSRIRQAAPSLREGNVPNFNDVRREILALNRLPDRQVTPELRPGAEPGSLEIDLKVKDELPLHGSLELNNRYSGNTTPLRLNGTLSYANLFQLGHTLGLSFQVAPERLDDGKVFSGYYLARTSENLSLMFQATRQDSDLSTLGGATVAGRGTILGLRAIRDLPSDPRKVHSISFGIDSKDFDEDLSVGESGASSPIHYYPISAAYSAAWNRPGSFTDANLSLNLHLRGLGSNSEAFNVKRYQSDGSFFYLRGDTSHTRDLAHGGQWYVKLQGQWSGQPLVNSEQFAGGGLGSARGYREATALGDRALFGTAEYRTPSWTGTANEFGHRSTEWRLHAFADAGVLQILKPLPAQQETFSFLSLGVGTRFRFDDRFHGSLDIAAPLLEPVPDATDVRVTFRGWASF